MAQRCDDGRRSQDGLSSWLTAIPANSVSECGHGIAGSWFPGSA